MGETSCVFYWISDQIKDTADFIKVNVEDKKKNYNEFIGPE